MGDGGSYFLGFSLAVSSILAFNNNIVDSGGSLISIHILFLIFLVPLVDMVYVMIKRIQNDKSPFYPDRSHIHHRLLRKGFNKNINILIKNLKILNRSINSLYLSLLYLLTKNK